MNFVSTIIVDKKNNKKWLLIGLTIILLGIIVVIVSYKLLNKKPIDDIQKPINYQEQLKEISSRSGIWESSRNKESRQELVEQLQKLEDQEEESRNAAQTIKDNERVVLSLSKENTILSYEQKSIIDTFGSFEDFELANRNLYANYLASLNGSEGKQVDDDEQ